MTRLLAWPGWGWVFHRVTGAVAMAVAVAGSPLVTHILPGWAAAVLAALGYVVNQAGAHRATKPLPILPNPLGGSMDSIIAIIASILDQPALQDPAATVAAGVLKKALPDVTEKTLGDFLVRIGQKLGGS